MSDSLKEKIRADLNSARRARDKARTLVLTTVLSEIRNTEIASGSAADNEAVRGLLAKAIKQRKDAAAQMTAGGRPELAAKERAQAEVLGSYLPPPLSEDAVRQMVQEAVAGGASHMGQVMSRLMPQIRGRFDGKEASRIVREELR